MTLYVDYENGDDSDDGSTIALGKLTLLSGTGAIANATAGEDIFVRDDSSASNPESYGAAQTVSFGAGTRANPIRVMGIKSTVLDSDTPLQNNDLAVKGTDSLPILQTTVGDLDYNDSNAGVIWSGMNLKCAASHHILGDSYLDWIDIEFATSANASVVRWGGRSDRRLLFHRVFTC